MPFGPINFNEDEIEDIPPFCEVHGVFADGCVTVNDFDDEALTDFGIEADRIMARLSLATHLARCVQCIGFLQTCGVTVSEKGLVIPLPKPDTDSWSTLCDDAHTLIRKAM